MILNQVTGNNVSQLLGYVETAGKKADLVIANPNGIVCKGCGFLNNASVTLTTGSASPENSIVTTQCKD